MDWTWLCQTLLSCLSIVSIRIQTSQLELPILNFKGLLCQNQYIQYFLFCCSMSCRMTRRMKARGGDCYGPLDNLEDAAEMWDRKYTTNRRCKIFHEQTLDQENRNEKLTKHFSAKLLFSHGDGHGAILGVIHGTSHGVGCGVRHGVDRLEVSHVVGLRVSSVMESVIGLVCRQL